MSTGIGFMSEKFQTVRGMSDLLTKQMMKKQYLEDLCRSVFEKYGFQPIQTPIVEDFALLAKKGSGGEAIKEEIYYFKDKSERELGLRFDLTVPFARILAANPQLPKPFKRYQIERVYRYDRPGAQRYREFTQADIDIAGVQSVLADFEIIAIAIEIFEKLETNFYIKLNNKKLLEEIALACNVKEENVKSCLRSIDKLDKIGWSGIEKELNDKKIDSKILNVLKENNLEKIEKILKEKTGFEELQNLINLLKKEKLEKFAKVDLSLARGLEYYTGNVFEAIAEGKFSCGGGGRYDKLVENYGGQSTPAIGFSFGIDRILDVLEEKQKIPGTSKTQIFIAPVNGTGREKVLEICQKIRKLGLNVEMDLMQRSISKSLDYCDKQKIPLVIMIGENEIQQQELTIKEMKTGKQSKLKFSELEKLKELFK